MGVSEHERVSTRDKERAGKCKEGHTRSRQKGIQLERGSPCENNRLSTAYPVMMMIDKFIHITTTCPRSREREEERDISSDKFIYITTNMSTSPSLPLFLPNVERLLPPSLSLTEEKRGWEKEHHNRGRESWRTGTGSAQHVRERVGERMGGERKQDQPEPFLL